MVDFNNETTIGTPALDIERVLVLQSRANTLEALESYYKLLESGAEPSLFIVKSRLIHWYLYIEPGLKRWKRKPEINFKQLYADLFLKDIEAETILNIISLFNEFLDYIRLTRLDNRLDYDKTDIEADNKYHGYG